MYLVVSIVGEQQLPCVGKCQKGNEGNYPHFMIHHSCVDIFGSSIICKLIMMRFFLARFVLFHLWDNLLVPGWCNVVRCWIQVINFSTGRSLCKISLESNITSIDIDHTGHVVFAGDTQV